MRRRGWRAIVHAIAAAAVALATATLALASGADADPSDLWWNPAEAGWGMQLVHGGGAVFATLFVYDASGKATFFTATLAQTGGAWLGPLYATTGPSFAGPAFDPAQVGARNVGTLAFVPLSAESATLRYAVDGAEVTTNVQRQLLRYDNYTGHHATAVRRVTTHCPDADANGDRLLLESVDIAQTGTRIMVDWNFAGRTCRLDGNFHQAGRLGYADTSYTCADGEEGNLALFELTKRNEFLAGRFQGHSISHGCDYVGQFTGLIAN